MTSILRDRARANGSTAAEPGPAGEPDVEADELEPIEYTDDITDAEKVPVHVAWARVMADVKSVAKSGRAEIKTEKGSYKFSYRGIDQVLNATGPALRRHGVMVIPVKVDTTYGTSGRMREVQVAVTYDIIGPQGDKIAAFSVGEGLDVGERGTTKALTNAYRNLLIAALTLPTEDPKLDPDKVNIERPEPVRPKATDYLDEVTDPRTSPRRLLTIKGEVFRFNLGNVMVVNETGDDEQLIDLINRMGRERSAAGQA